MTCVVCILGTSPVSLWGLDGAARLTRQLKAAGVAVFLRDDEAPPPDATVLLLRGDHLFDDRILRDLLAAPGTLLVLPAAAASSTVVAAHVAAAQTAALKAVLSGSAGPGTISGLTTHTPATMSAAYVGKLLKSSPPVVLPIRADRAARLERHLFDGSYKGVTDLVTKWALPAPARAATRFCVRRGITPNAVTTMSLVLTLLATLLFAQGHFAAGLAAGWFMTFLDTVDGKLARVTVTSTQFGHLFDHLIDLFHPPLWYIAWGWGLDVDSIGGWSLDSIDSAIVAGYVVGRLIEGAFDWLLAGFPMFSWRPVDSYFRLVLARRNPNLLLLSGFALIGFPEQGLLAVAVWTVVSTVLLGFRLGQAVFLRLRDGRLTSWLQEVGTDLAQAPAYARPFAADTAALSELM